MRAQENKHSVQPSLAIAVPLHLPKTRNTIPKTAISSIPVAVIYITDILLWPTTLTAPRKLQKTANLVAWQSQGRQIR